MVLFLDKGYYLFMDNYDISVGQELHESKTLSCRVQQSSLPKDIFHLKARAVKKTQKRSISLQEKRNLYRDSCSSAILAQCMNWPSGQIHQHLPCMCYIGWSHQCDESSSFPNGHQFSQTFQWHRNLPNSLGKRLQQWQSFCHAMSH